MRRTASVTVQNETVSYDGEGMRVTTWSAIQTAEAVEKVNKQPLSGEIAFKEYGISEAGITHLFFLGTDSSAAENGRIVDGSDTYDIYRVEKYPNHWEAITKLVVS